MDLIYTDKNLVEIGVLKDYALDLAYGTSENNFELTLSFAEHCCDIGYYFYIVDTEYGGIIDEINVDTANGTIKYSGRTWHGILENKIIQPDKGSDYYILNGDANNCIRAIIERVGLSSLFYCPNAGMGTDINNYKVRYGNAYTVLIDALRQSGLKLHMHWAGSIIYVEATPTIDYGSDEQWLNAHQLFNATKRGNRVNHVICLGRGELADRYVIHLFADKNGGVKQYNIASIIVDDSGYILDERNKVLTGSDEITLVYDNNNAAETTHYVALTSQPAGWDKRYTEYFDDPQGKAAPKPIEKEEMPPTITTIPGDWSTNYSNYYTYSNNQFKNVEAVVIETPENYEPITGMPENWANTAQNYFYWKTDGVSGQWTRVSLVPVYDYIAQTEMPSDWNTDSWKNYYVKWNTFVSVKGVSKKFETLTTSYYKEVAPNWKKNTYYKQSSKGNYILLEKQPKNWDSAYTSYFRIGTTDTYVSANTKYGNRPTWIAKEFYTYMEVGSVAPAYDPTLTYAVYIPASSSKVAPQFVAGVYYSQGTKIKATYPPVFIPGRYFEKRIDHYAELVSGGLKKLNEYYNSDQISMNLAADDYTYDIGDLVSATESITGVSTLTQPITKKIVKIDNTGMSIEYQIGGK